MGDLLGKCLVAMIHNVQKCVSVFPDLFFNSRFSILFFIQLIFLKLYWNIIVYNIVLVSDVQHSGTELSPDFS